MQIFWCAFIFMFDTIFDVVLMLYLLYSIFSMQVIDYAKCPSVKGCITLLP